MAKKKSVCVIGAAIFDLMGFPKQMPIRFDSVPGSVSTACGGVGRNIAENAQRLGLATELVTVFGDDIFSKIMLEEKGLYYKDKRTKGFLKASALKAVNTTGAGDAMMAGLVYGYLAKWTIEKSARLEMACSNLTILDPNPVHPNISLERVLAQG